MNTPKTIVGIILIGLGLLFFFNNKNISKGAAEFYQKFYTEKNLKIIFKIVGAILFFGGFIIIFTK